MMQAPELLRERFNAAILPAETRQDVKAAADWLRGQELPGTDMKGPLLEFIDKTIQLDEALEKQFGPRPLYCWWRDSRDFWAGRTHRYDTNVRQEMEVKVDGLFVPDREAANEFLWQCRSICNAHPSDGPECETAFGRKLSRMELRICAVLYDYLDMWDDAVWYFTYNEWALDGPVFIRENVVNPICNIPLCAMLLDNLKWFKENVRDDKLNSDLEALVTGIVELSWGGKHDAPVWAGSGSRTEYMLSRGLSRGEKGCEQGGLAAGLSDCAPVYYEPEWWASGEFMSAHTEIVLGFAQRRIENLERRLERREKEYPGSGVGVLDSLQKMQVFVNLLLELTHVSGRWRDD